jgi:hypothetical protein
MELIKVIQVFDKLDFCQFFIKQKYNFGDTIQKAVTEAASSINNHVNPHFPSVLKSGTNVPDAIQFCRAKYFDHLLNKHAVRNVQSNKSRYLQRNPEMKRKWTEAVDKTEEKEWEAVEMERQTQKIQLNFGPLWFPSFWLSFLLIGIPAPERCWRNALIMNGRLSDVESSNGLIRELGGRTSRHEAKRAEARKRYRSSPDVDEMTFDLTEDKTGKARGIVVTHQHVLPPIPPSIPPPIPPSAPISRLAASRNIASSIASEVEVLKQLAEKYPQNETYSHALEVKLIELLQAQATITEESVKEYQNCVVSSGNRRQVSTTPAVISTSSISFSTPSPTSGDKDDVSSTLFI